MTETGRRAVGQLAHEMGQSVSSLKKSVLSLREAAAGHPAYQEKLADLQNQLSRIAVIARQMSVLYWRIRSRPTLG